jgi:YD repeat-containing protein
MPKQRRNYLPIHLNGDFGYGWTLDIATTEISIVIGNGQTAKKGFSPNEAIQDGTHITITLPDGTKEGFTFQAKSANNSSSPFAGYAKTPYYYPNWVPDVGTKSTLAVPQILLYAWGDGTYYMMDDYGDGMNDYSPAAGSAFLTLTLRNGVDLVIDATTGKLCEAVDLNGNKLTFTEHGITHSSGKGVVFERDYEGRISSITGPDGRRVEYTYDNKSDLIAVKDQTGATVQFTYLTDPKAPKHYLDQVIDPLGRTAAKTEFDEQGRIKKVIDAEGKVIEYDFDTESRIQKVTDQLGNTTIIENDDQGNVIREVSPEGAITLRTYDSKGNTLTETQVVNHNGQEIHLTTTYTYDADGNKLSETDPRGNTTTYSYNKYGQVLSTTSNGVTTYTNYDQNTGLPKSTTDTNGNVTNYSFDSKGNMTSLTNSNGVQLIYSTYNKYGEVTSIKSTNGRTTYFEYNNNGDCIATYYVENGVKVLDETIYDNARKVIGRKHYVGGELIWETKTEYNVAGQVVKEIDQNGLITLYTYDTRGLETEVRSQSKGSDGQIIWTIQRTVYDAAGRTTYGNGYTEGINVTKINGSHTEYDKDGRSIRNEQLLGLIIDLDSNGRSFVRSIGEVISSSSTEYNNAGWVVSSIDSNGLRTEYIYNVFGETTRTRRELIGGEWLVSETVYDSQGRVVFSTDSHLEGSTDPVYGTKSIYDSKGRSVGSIRYKNSEIEIAPDGSSSIKTVGTEIYRTSTEYDDKGRVKSSTDAYGNVTTYEYDNLDRQVKVYQPEGIISETVYDSQGRVWKSIIRAGNEVRTTEYKYDMYGNIIETIQPDGTTIKAVYNVKGQKISETNQLGQTRYFEYDDNGQLVKVILPDGATYKYAYDSQGNQTSIIDPLNRETKFTYDDNGNQLTRTLPDGSTEYFEYDYKGRLIKQISFEGVETIFKYDEFERLTSKTFSVNGVTETWTYTYDQYGRVSEIDQNGRIVKTTYDSHGRTKSIETPEGIISYTYDEFGRQTSVQTDNDPPTIYSYDNFGRLNSVTSDGKTTKYEYDAFGNLAKTTLPNGVITTYEYDNMNRLIKETNYVDKNNNGTFDKDQGEGN